jgi:hypothetical protein
MAMICFPTSKREDHLLLSKLSAIDFSCVAPGWPLPKARLGVILDQAIIGKSGAEGDLLDSVRQTLDERSPAKCPAILG